VTNPRVETLGHLNYYFTANVKWHCKRIKMHPTGYRQKGVPIKSFIMGEGKTQVKHVDGREKDPPSKWKRRWPQNGSPRRVQRKEHGIAKRAGT
jgi:hypothetical protein